MFYLGFRGFWGVSSFWPGGGQAKWLNVVYLQLVFGSVHPVIIYCEICYDSTGGLDIGGSKGFGGSVFDPL